MKFTEDNFYRVMTNLHIITKILTMPAHRVLTEEDQSQLYIAVEEATDMACMLEYNFFEQFKYTPRVRRVCPNPECKHIYAYFYEDFLYCPKCGTKLVTTRDDRKESMDHDQENARIQSSDEDEQ